MKRPVMPPPSKRLRRTPAEARETILTAAERVLASRGPDAATLKDVAREAGVSHALVTHYFGTYAALVEETMARRVLALRSTITKEVLAGGEPLSVHGVLRSLGRAFLEPANMRLIAWALLSGRMQSADFFPARIQGLRMMVDVLEARIATEVGAPVPRADVEFLVTASIAALHGYAFGRGALAGALGKVPSADADEEFITRLGDMIELYVRGRAPPPARPARRAVRRRRSPS